MDFKLSFPVQPNFPDSTAKYCFLSTIVISTNVTKDTDTASWRTWFLILTRTRGAPTDRAENISWADSTGREMSRNVEKCREMPRNVEKCRVLTLSKLKSRNAEKRREMSRNVEFWKFLNKIKFLKSFPSLLKVHISYIELIKKN